MDMEVVGKRIQALRKEHKMTQQQLAEAIYKGLRNYFLAHPMQSAPQGATAQTASTVTTPDRTLPN